MVNMALELHQLSDLWKLGVQLPVWVKPLTPEFSLINHLNKIIMLVRIVSSDCKTQVSMTVIIKVSSIGCLSNQFLEKS